MLKSLSGSTFGQEPSPIVCPLVSPTHAKAAIKTAKLCVLIFVPRKVNEMTQISKAI